MLDETRLDYALVRVFAGNLPYKPAGIHAKSLREICGGLAASGKLRHLGVPTAPSRSTLAYANEHRPGAIRED
jgi:hypothetical protein